jgi:hypothetical protein
MTKIRDRAPNYTRREMNDPVGELNLMRIIAISSRRLSFPRMRESMIFVIMQQNFMDSHFRGNDIPRPAGTRF